MSEQQQNIKIVISVRNIDKKYTFPHYLGTYCIIYHIKNTHKNQQLILCKIEEKGRNVKSQKLLSHHQFCSK